MKTWIALLLISSTAWSAECILKGKTINEQTIETSFDASDSDACKNLAEKTKTNNFFNLIEKDDHLVETSMTFKEESISKETISFDDESNL
jgi:hypothetical protein